MKTYIENCPAKEKICKERCPLYLEGIAPSCYQPLTTDRTPRAEVTLDCGVMPETRLYAYIYEHGPHMTRREINYMILGFELAGENGHENMAPAWEKRYLEAIKA